MRRLLAVFVVSIVIAVTGVAYAGLQADFSKSYTEALDTQTLRIRQISNIIYEGTAIPGEFWIDFVWDQQNWILTPTGNVGQEQLPLEFDGTYTGSWSKTCPACGITASAGTFPTTLTTGLFTNRHPNYTSLTGQAP